MESKDEKRAAIFPSKLSYLHRIHTWIREQIRDTLLSKKEQTRLEIAMEEVIVNIMKYAYGEREGMIEILYELRPAKLLKFTIKDRGIPFNPLEHTITIDKESSFEARKEGGLGIHMIREFVDHATYVYEAGENQLTLTMNLQ